MSTPPQPAVALTPLRLAGNQAVARQATAQPAAPQRADTQEPPILFEVFLGDGVHKADDVTFATRVGRQDAARLRKTGSLSAEDRREINAKLAFFKGRGKDAYLMHVRPALAEVTPDRRLVPSPVPTDVGAQTRPVVQAADEADLVALEKAYADTRVMEEALFDMRQVGAREALANLLEKDPPSIADVLLQAAVLGALGLATGGVSMAIASKLTTTAEVVLANAIQTGIDDAMKAAVPPVLEKVFADEAPSRSSYFAGIEEGVIRLKQAALLSLNAHEASAKRRAQTEPDSLPAELDAVRKRRATLEAAQDTARNSQYTSALSQWLVLLARNKLGDDKKLGGIDLAKMPGYGRSPERFYKRAAVPGVLQLTFGMARARRPLPIIGATIEGLNDAARRRLASTKIRDLGLPVFAQGWIVDGLLDSVFDDANEVTMTLNETRAVSINYGSDAKAAMLSPGFAKGMTKPVDIAREILLNDFGDRTLSSILK